MKMGHLFQMKTLLILTKKVIMHLNVSGWAVTNTVSFPGASEKISTSDGDVLLDENDLLDTYSTTGVSPEDAERITLSAVITQASKIYDYFLVEFKVWDKKSNSSVSGFYKLYLKL